MEILQVGGNLVPLFVVTVLTDTPGGAESWQADWHVLRILQK